MKKPGLFAASMAAASASAYSVSSSSSSTKSPFPKKEGDSYKEEENSGTRKSDFSDKFAPRFDGLRFIETLVTAHR